MEKEYDYIETMEAGAGSYPEPPEDVEKCYQFDFNATIKGYGYVYAKDEEEARRLIAQDDYDDIMDTFDMDIVEITRVEEN